MNHIIYVGKHLLTLTVSRHAHSSWELVYCTVGSGTFHFDDGDLPYKKGDVVILPPYVPHGNSSRDGFTNIHMNMTDTSLPFKSPAIVQDDSNQFLLQAFQAIYFHFNGDPHRRRLLMSPYGDLIYCYLMCYHKTQPLSPVVEEIENTVMSYDGIVGVHDLMVHDYGVGRMVISLHAEISSKTDIMLAHELIDLIEDDLREKYRCSVTIHMDPVVVDDKKADEVKKVVLDLLKNIDSIITIHDFRITDGVSRINVIFDLVTPFGFRYKDGELALMIKNAIAEKDGRLNAVITVERSMC